MPDETYNGWTNRATWLMSMYLDGNYDGEGTYRETREWVKSARGSNTGAFRLGESLREHFSDQIKDSVEDAMVGLIIDDLLSYALDSVNWHEIATNLLSES